MPWFASVSSSFGSGGNTGGPPIVRLMPPLAARIASRTIFGVEPLRAEPPQILVLADPSRDPPHPRTRTPSGTPRRSSSAGASALMLQPRFMNSTASQSSSCGCVGGSPILPKLSSVATMPRPKWWCQMRLTITRAVSGFCARAEPLGQRPPAARRAAVGGRNLGRRVAIGRRGDEARLHHRAFGVRIAAEQEVATAAAS